MIRNKELPVLGTATQAAWLVRLTAEKAPVDLTQSPSAVAGVWQLAIRQEQSAWPRACGSDTCPDSTFLKKAAGAMLPATCHDHGTR